MGFFVLWSVPVPDLFPWHGHSPECPCPHGGAGELTCPGWVFDRVSGAGEKRTKMKWSGEMEEQPQRLIQNQEQGRASLRGVGECSLSLHCGSGPALPEALKPSSGAVEGVSCQGSWPQPRCMDSEEQRWDVAVRDHSLAGVLAPLASPGTASEVMNELLVAGERQAWRKCLQQDWHLEALAQDR